MIGDPCFFRQNVFPALHIFDVGNADIRHHGTGRLYHGGDPGHFPGHAHPHFHHGGGVLLPQAADSDGNTYLAVLISGGLMYIVLRRKGLGHHFLGGSFPHAAGNAHHRNGKLASVPGPHLLQSRPAIVYQNQRARAGRRFLLRKGSSRTVFQGHADKFVAVCFLPANGDEHCPRLCLPAVCKKGGDHGILIAAKQGPPRGLDNFRKLTSHKSPLLTARQPDRAIGPSG